MARLADVIDHGETMEYWKSAPYLLNFMEQYELRRKLDRHAEDKEGRSEIAEAVGDAEGTLLDWKEIEAYNRVDPANARMRWLVHRTIENGAWRLLWIPPARPNMALGGAFAEPALRSFTKTLGVLVLEGGPESDRGADQLRGRAADDARAGGPAAEYARKRVTRGVPCFGSWRMPAGPRSRSCIRALRWPRLRMPFCVIRLSSGRSDRSRKSWPPSRRGWRPPSTQLVAQRATEVGEDEQWYWIAPILLDRLA